MRLWKCEFCAEDQSRLPTSVIQFIGMSIPIVVLLISLVMLAREL